MSLNSNRRFVPEYLPRLRRLGVSGRHSLSISTTRKTIVRIVLSIEWKFHSFFSVFSWERDSLRQGEFIYATQISIMLPPLTYFQSVIFTLFSSKRGCFPLTRSIFNSISARGSWAVKSRGRNWGKSLPGASKSFVARSICMYIPIERIISR